MTTGGSSRGDRTRSALLWIAFGAIGCSHIYCSWQLLQTRRAIANFEQEHERSEWNPDRVVVNAIALPKAGEWRFHVEKPLGQKIRICGSLKNVQHNTPKAESQNYASPYTWHSGGKVTEHPDFKVDVFLRRDTNGLSVHVTGGFGFGLTVPEDHPLFNHSLDDLKVSVLPDTTSEGNGLPRVLVRIQDPADETRGLVVWLEHTDTDHVK